MTHRVLVLLAMAIGCGEVKNKDGDAAIPDDTAAACGDGGTCVALPDDGWTGPVTYASASQQVPACSGNYPTEELVAFQNLDEGTAECGCTCGALTFACGSVTATGYAGTNCTTAVGNISMALNTCISVSESAGTFPTTNSFDFDLSNPTASCGAPTTSETLPTPAFGTSGRVCGGAQEATPGACGSEAFCAPAADAPFGALCVFKDGDNECPAAFPTKELVHRGFTDSRSCTACSCAPQNATCTAVVRRFQNGTNNCAGSSTSDVNVSQAGSNCILRNQDGLRTVSITANPNRTCAKSGGELTGEVTVDQPTTICCR